MAQEEEVEEGGDVMPWETMHSDSCPSDKPWAVVKKGSKSPVACHETEALAQEHMAALYANEKAELTAKIEAIKERARDWAKSSNTSSAFPKDGEMSVKDLHDLWLERLPEGSSHDPEECSLCPLVEEEATGGTGDSMSDKTHTEAEVTAAVAAAVKPLEEKISALENDRANEQIEERIATAKSELEAELAEAKKELDLATARAEAAEQKVADTEAYLKAEEDRVREEAAAAERRENRIAQVKEHANFTKEYIEAQADRWASWSDEEFAGFLEDLKAAGVVKPSEKKDDEIPGDTRLATAREEAASETQGSKSHLSTILDLRRAGFDARRLA